MKSLTTGSRLLPGFAGAFIGGVWIFHGLYSKILDGVPRHREIVGRILGEGVADIAAPAIGALEILLGCWVLAGRRRRICASVQIFGIFSMNALEILLARDLLISAGGMVALNLCFIALIWWWSAQENHPICRKAQTPKSEVKAVQMREKDQ